MNQKKKAVFNWSGGKDSALALQTILKEGNFDVIALLTTLNADTLNSSLHAIPLAILEMQADSIGIPLYPVLLNKTTDYYENKMTEAVNHFKDEGVGHFIFGDIFLEDVKAYRENQLNPVGIEVVEPLWGKGSEEIIEEFLQSGIKTKIIVTQADKLGESYIGKELDRAFINSLPENVDLCGENGEYHTLAYAGDLFKKELKFSIVSTKKIAYNFKLEDGEEKTFEYWHAQLSSTA